MVEKKEGECRTPHEVVLSPASTGYKWNSPLRVTSRIKVSFPMDATYRRPGPGSVLSDARNCMPLPLEIPITTRRHGDKSMSSSPSDWLWGGARAYVGTYGRRAWLPPGFRSKQGHRSMVRSRRLSLHVALRRSPFPIPLTPLEERMGNMRGQVAPIDVIHHIS